MRKYSGGVARSWRAGIWVGSSALLSITGCSAVAPSEAEADGTAEVVGSSESQLVVSTTPAAYLQSCWDNNVPKPPPWGLENIGADKPWFSRGVSPASDAFLMFGGANIWFSNPPQKDGRNGICVIAAHMASGMDSGPGAFDIICQSSSSQPGGSPAACFWEGFQNASPDAGAPSNIDLLGPGWTSGGKPVEPPTPTSCTNCHAGHNVFISHYAPLLADGSPGSALAPPTPNEIAARPGLETWMPAAYGYVPLGTEPNATSLGGSNPAKDTFSGYPASTSGCPTCHTNAVGGSFPLLSTAQFQGDTLCRLISTVTNRPASTGGMPPTWKDGSVNNCTPSFDCAQQRDPFVQKMLASCGTAYDPGGTGATPAFARDIHPATPFIFKTSAPAPRGVYMVATSQDSSGSGFLAKYAYKFSDDGWGLPGINLPKESSTANFYTSNRPAGYLKGATKRSFVVTSYARYGDAFGQVGDVYEHTIDDGKTSNVTKGAFTPVGQPAPLYRADGYNSIYVSDPDGWLHQFDWDANTSSWGGNYNLHNNGQMQVAKSSPMAFTGINGAIVVHYACGVRSGCEMRYNWGGGGWTERVTTSPVTLVAGTRPTAIYYNFSQYMFFTTTSGLYMAVDSGTGYSTPARISGTTARFFSSPMPYIRGDGRLEVLINYTDSSGAQNLRAYTLTGSSWSLTTLFSYTAAGVTPVIGDPVGYVRHESGNRNGALFVDANRNVRNVQQQVANGPWGFEPSANHGSASLLVAAGAFKKYAP